MPTDILQPADFLDVAAGAQPDEAARVPTSADIEGLVGEVALLRGQESDQRRDEVQEVTGVKRAGVVGEAAHIPYPDNRFDRAFAVHVLYFWHEPRGELREIHRVLRQGGLLLLGFRPKDDPAVVARSPESVYALRSVREVEELLGETGWEGVRTETDIDRGRQMAWAVARK